MIISASRRTDLPAAHADWLFERFREGFALVRNPMNPRQVQRVSLRPEDVDGVVFWTKNPIPMLDRLDALREYAYYFQYTLTGYAEDVEPRLPDLARRVDAFLELSRMLGRGRVLWRCDPILLSEKYDVSWHIRNFERLAGWLRGATDQVTISFVDTYARNRRRLESIGSRPISQAEMGELAAALSEIARSNQMTIAACSEETDLTGCGVAPARCVDAGRLAGIGGVPLRQIKDPNQRSHCGCAPSVDIGAYNTCPNGCAYCYANYSPALLREHLSRRDDEAAILCGALEEGDRVTERKAPPLREAQISMEW